MKPNPPSLSAFNTWCHALRQQRVHKFHFIGIGGAGMCGLAELLQGLGFDVSGSDQQHSAVLTRLAGEGVITYVGHQAEHCAGAHVVVMSSAISATNPEVIYAQQHHIPILRRGQLLGEMMRYHYGISISGSHGKTTTSSLMACVFLAAQLDPTASIGGRVEQWNANTHLGAGPYFIAEADESDVSMLHQTPTVVVVTNVDPDHMDTYDQNISLLHQTFIDFVQKVPFYGVAILGIDDPGVQAMMPKITVPTLTFGFSEHSAVRATNVRVEGWQTHFVVHYPEQLPFEVTLNLPGNHNVLNALVVIAAALFCGVDREAIKVALATFKGVHRRNQFYGELPYRGKTIALLDDYGHHPTEIHATLGAMRAVWPERRLVLIYQLHRYTRTRDLLVDFIRELSQADQVILMDIYAASEAPIEQVSALSVLSHLPKNAYYAAQAVDVMALLPTVLKPHDVLVVMGAGDIAVLPKQIQEWLNKG
jgi:UDP-N-acetylmuramate--alanine ligase